MGLFSRSTLENRQDTRSPSLDRQKALANVTWDKDRQQIIDITLDTRDGYN